MAIVLRLTTGMLTAAVALLPPEPTLIVAPPPPLDPAVPPLDPSVPPVAPVVAVAASPGMPVLLPGCTLDIPPEPVMENDVGMAVPLVELPGVEEAPGKGFMRT